MADGAIGFLQKRKRSSRKGAERAIGVVFVTLSLALSFSRAGEYTLTGKRDLWVTVGYIHTVGCRSQFPACQLTHTIPVLKINARCLVFLAQFNPSVVPYPSGGGAKGEDSLP